MTTVCACEKTVVLHARAEGDGPRGAMGLTSEHA